MSICWGAIDFGKGYDTANQSAYLDSILRHGLDWLIKVSFFITAKYLVLTRPLRPTLPIIPSLFKSRQLSLIMTIGAEIKPSLSQDQFSSSTKPIQERMHLQAAQLPFLHVPHYTLIALFLLHFLIGRLCKTKPMRQSYFSTQKL